MPIYTYDCPKCGQASEHLTSYAERDNPRACETPGADLATLCGGALVRHGVELFTHGQPSFQTHAILESGKKVAGQFGKAARKKKGWYRP